MVLPAALDYWPLAERDGPRGKGASLATKGTPPPPDGEACQPAALDLADA